MQSSLIWKSFHRMLNWSRPLTKGDQAMNSDESEEPSPQKNDDLKFDQQEINSLIEAIGETGESAEYRKDVRLIDRHGVFFRWPEEDDFEWVHPDDRELVDSMIPGRRIFCRTMCEDPDDQAAGYYSIEYGGVKIRIKPAMWLHVDHEGYEVGDRIEVKSKHGRHHPVIGNICEIEYDHVQRQTLYFIEVNGLPLEKKFLKDDIRPCRRLGQPLSTRERELLHREQL